MTLAQTSRDIQEREHELYPLAKNFGHRNCRVCGPGVLKNGEVPSSFNHIFYKTDRVLLTDEYGGSWWGEQRKECMPEYAQVVSSEIDDKRGRHTIMVDVDLPARLVETTTPGHHHLYIDLELSWWKYRRLLRALMRAGVVSKGYYKMSLQRKATHLRPPWATKGIDS